MRRATRRTEAAALCHDSNGGRLSGKASASGCAATLTAKRTNSSHKPIAYGRDDDREGGFTVIVREWIGTGESVAVF